MDNIVTAGSSEAAAISILRRFLDELPPADFAFAYGSGIFIQLPSPAERGAPLHRNDTIVGGRSEDGCSGRRQVQHASKASSPRQLDMIIATGDTATWHAQNLTLNPHHYSALSRTLGGQQISSLSEHVGVGVFFNPFVAFNSESGMAAEQHQQSQVLIKYGVTSLSSLLSDLSCWHHLFLAGRLHKPVTALLPLPSEGGEGGTLGERGVGVMEEGEEQQHQHHHQQQQQQHHHTSTYLTGHMAANRRGALAAALLGMPAAVPFTESSLFASLSSLSYAGDVRLMAGAEQPHKVPRIVAGSLPLFQSLYRPLLRDLEGRGCVEKGEVREQHYGRESEQAALSRSPRDDAAATQQWVKDPSPKATATLLACLPPAIVEAVALSLPGGSHLPLNHSHPLHHHPHHHHRVDGGDWQHRHGASGFIREEVLSMQAPASEGSSHEVMNAEMAHAMSTRSTTSEIHSALAATLRRRVRASSVRQVLLGAITTSPMKNANYLLHKFMKAWSK